MNKLGLISGESNLISPSLAEGDKGGGCNTQNNSIAKFLNDNFTHPLAPSAREGESIDSSLRGRQPEAIQKNKIDCHDLPLANLAMTRWSALNRHCEGDSPKQSAGFTKETSASPCFANEVKQPSKSNRHIERSEISKGCESNKKAESMTEKRNDTDSSQVRDSQKAQILHNRLPRLDCVKSRNDEAGTDCHNFTQGVESRNDNFGVDCFDLTIAKSRNDEAVVDSCDLDSSLVSLARNDEFMVDSHNDNSR